MNLSASFHLVCIALVLAGTAIAGQPANRPLPEPASESEKEHWRRHGRTLPAPESQQPPLDPGLPPYQPAPGVELTGSFQGTCSDVLVDLTRRWIAAFQRHHPKVSLQLASPFAGSLGARELIKGDLSFVMVSRELKPDDLTDFRAKFGYDPTSVPIVGGSWRHFGFLDSVVFFVHADNPLSSLTFEQLDALLSTTRHRGGKPVRTWDDLGLSGEWTGKKINVWGIEPWNGFEEFVRQRVLGTGEKRGEWRRDLNFVKTVFPVSKEVASDRYAIGYAGRAYVGPGVKLLALAKDPRGPAEPPTYEKVALAEYPLSRLCFMNFNQAPAQPAPPALAEFLRFILSREGQQVALEQGIFLPLRSAQAAASLERLRH